MRKVIIILTNLIFVFGFTQEVTKEPSNEVMFHVIENVPVFIGCEGLSSNQDKKRCMSKKIQKLISKKFDTSISDNLGLPSGVVSIYVNFKIDKEGKVTNIKARAPHLKLEEEAIRVISQIPVMKPGLDRGKPVVVAYTLPIKFNVQNEVDKNFPIHRDCENEIDGGNKHQCSMDKVKTFIESEFDKKIVKKGFQSKKPIRVDLSFTVDKKGHIKNIITTSKDESVSEKITKIAKKLPKFIPSSNEIENMPVALSMTIYF